MRTVRVLLKLVGAIHPVMIDDKKVEILKPRDQ